MLNRVVLVGRLVKDPELRRTQSGTAVTSFTIAVDNRHSANQEKSTSFFSVVTWNTTAEFVSSYIKKGYLVGVDGRLQQRAYENNSGQKIQVVEVIAEQVQNYQPKDGNAVAQATANEPADSGQNIDDDDLPF